MTSILSELYYGNLFPMENITSGDPEYYPLGQKIDAEFESLKEKLCEEDNVRLDRLCSDCLGLSAMSDYASFSHGMRLGALLMCEIFSGETR